jgi:hypothetical protein
MQTFFSIAPQAVVDTLREQAADLRSPPWTLEILLDALERSGVPSFASTVRAFVAAPG